MQIPLQVCTLIRNQCDFSSSMFSQYLPQGVKKVMTFMHFLDFQQLFYFQTNKQ